VNSLTLLEQIFRAGVVGSGGAGFPTHKKLTGGAKMLIINAVECEPLLASDRYVMRNFAREITESLLGLQTEMGFERVVVGTKKKYTREIAALKAAFESSGAGFEIFGLESIYPAGDEQILIYEITGKTVPPGGIPLALGIVVLNVTTLLHISDAMQGRPVISKFVTVTGAVAHPAIIRTPVGTFIPDLIAAAGGALSEPYAVIKGGPMMGKQYTCDEARSLTIGKADGGIVVLPADHHRISFSDKPVPTILREARSVCIQCSYCTELCPRYLIGHKMRPHRVMRSMATSTCEEDLTDALLCSECGVCELFSCPMGLSPRRVNIYVKELLRKNGSVLQDRNIYPEQAQMRMNRRVAQSRFIDRLSLSRYPTGVDDIAGCASDKVTIPLKHGVGKPSELLVKAGDKVKPGDVIAGVGFDDVGCMIHASVEGTVTSVEGGVTIERGVK